MSSRHKEERADDYWPWKSPGIAWKQAAQGDRPSNSGIDYRYFPAAHSFC
jgi:hypothetical protein